jgi:1-acyl-sn-glycerol-3-phosphate acyltransferase
MEQGWMRRPWLAMVWVLCLLYWLIGGAYFIVAGWILRPLLPQERAAAVGQRWLSRAFQGFIWLLERTGVASCEFVDFDRLSSAEGPLIVAPNHPAIWDAVFIISRVGGLTCILKAALLKNPFLAGGALLSGFIPNEPDHTMVKRAVEVLKSGRRLLFFPEGTRTRKSENAINELRGGIALVAKHSRAPVWPVHVTTNSDYLSKGWPLWRLPDRRVKLRMVVGEPLTFGAEESPQDFLDRLRSAHLAALQPEVPAVA